ncbi:MAG TPA: glutamate racemase [Candidatus Saccharimonadales bacterium]|nr:glutamate racemase [Candidatus Saccharimonadales bacterium]
MKIGVFDSGVGGQSVANAIQAALPDDEIILREDREHVPYGSRQPAELLGFVVPIFDEMVAAGCQVIVVACNTVTTTIIKDLRERFSVPLVAVEPMVKPAAAATKSGVIAVCATPATLASQRYRELKNEFASSITVLEPDCSDWAKMVEDNQIEHDQIADRINQVLSNGADVIVLACTHYHWIEDEIKQLAKHRAEVIQPEPALIKQLKRVLEPLR